MAGFWTGADVVWTGADIAEGGHLLSVGDRAVIVDAGRHHVSSFGVLARGRHRARKGVVIRVNDEVELEVDPRHLELVAPDHPLQPESDGSVAAWWLDQLEPYDLPLTVASFVPRSLQSVVRVLHPWRDRDHDRAPWGQVASDLGVDDLEELHARYGEVVYGDGGWEDLAPYDEPHQGRLDQETAAVLVEVLGEATSTPDDVYVAVWEGWGGTPPERFPGAARLPTDARGHFLLRGPLTGVLASVAAVGEEPASGIWWPADRSWFVHTEVDFPWTLVAAGTDVARALHADTRLETEATRHEAIANTLQV